MSKQSIIIALMALVGVLIAGIAIYVFTQASSGLSLTQGIILVSIATIGLFIIMGIIFVLIRGMNIRK